MLNGLSALVKELPDLPLALMLAIGLSIGFYIASMGVAAMIKAAAKYREAGHPPTSARPEHAAVHGSVLPASPRRGVFARLAALMRRRDSM